MKILVVGSGLSGSRLAQLLSEEKNYEVSVWEKARGVGGRASTNRLLEEESEPCVDVGAQGICLQGPTSATTEAMDEQVSGSQAIVDALVAEGVLREVDVENESPILNIPHKYQGGQQARSYTAPLGMNSLCKSFLKSGGIQPQVGRRLTRIIARQHNQFACEDSSGAVEVFDGVVITVPPPQVCSTDGAGIAFEGDEVTQRVDALRKSVEASPDSRYSSRFALALYFPPDAWKNFSCDWTAKYVESLPAVRYVSCEWRRRTGKSDAEEAATGRGPSFVVCSSVLWGIKCVAEKAADAEIEKKMMTGFLEVVPQLKEIAPQKSHLSRWRYSQCRGIRKIDSGEAGEGWLALGERLWLAGDYFYGSSFQSCMRSAAEACAAVKQSLGTQ